MVTRTQSHPKIVAVRDNIIFVNFFKPNKNFKNKEKWLEKIAHNLILQLEFEGYLDLTYIEEL